MNLIKKLLMKKDTRRLYLMKDIFFVIDLENKTIIPILFNDDYSSVLRLDTMKICKHESTINCKDNYTYTPNYLIKKPKGVKSFTAFIYKTEEYEINDLTTKMLFAKDKPNMNFLRDIKILNANELNDIYYLSKHFKTLKKHVYSSEVSYTSQKEILDIVNFILYSKKFKKEIEKFNNEKNSVNSRSF